MNNNRKICQLAYQGLMAEKDLIELYEKDDYQQRTRPITVCGEYEMPDELDGEAVVNRAYDAMRELLLVHPELELATRDLLSKEKLDECVVNYDQLLKEDSDREASKRAEADRLLDKQNTLLKEFKTKGGYLYSQRYNLTPKNKDLIQYAGLLSSQMDDKTRDLATKAIIDADPHKVLAKARDAKLIGVVLTPETKNQPAQVAVPDSQRDKFEKIVEDECKRVFESMVELPHNHLTGSQKNEGLKHIHFAARNHAMGESYSVSRGMAMSPGFVPDQKMASGMKELLPYIDREIRNLRNQVFQTGPAGP